jgi:hypothetical protein
VDQSTMARRNPFSFTHFCINWYIQWFLMIICSVVFCITTMANKNCKTWWAYVKENEEVSLEKKSFRNQCVISIHVNCCHSKSYMWGLWWNNLHRCVVLWIHNKTTYRKALR